MKIIKRLIIPVIFLFSGISILLAQNTEGTDFWLTFGQIYNFPSNVVETQIRVVAGDQDASVNIYYTDLFGVVTFHVLAGCTYTYVLGTAETVASVNTYMGTSNRSIHISATNPVTVYSFTKAGQFAEASNILPVSSLGMEYYQISHQCYTNPYNEAYAVVAIQNGTTRLYHNKVLVATLNQGQVYYRMSDTDMTGSHITSDHPVAFFALNKYAAIPQAGLVSHLMQQLAPVNTWGKTFFVPVTLFESEIVRIVVAHDSTTITHIGGTIRTTEGGQPLHPNLLAGQFVDLDIDLINNGCFIQANKPVGVCSFMKSGYPGSGLQSLPSQAWIPGIEQLVSKALIAPFIPSTYSPLHHHYALIITPTSTKNNTKVSIGESLADTLSNVLWYDNANARMSFCSFPLTKDSTYIFSNSKGMIILGYGTGEGGGSPSYATYYYLAHSAMRTIDAAFYANDIHYEDLKDTTFCSNHINFRAEIENMGVEMDSLKWYINGIEKYTKLNHLEWDTTLSNGTYEITMWVLFKNDTIITRTGRLEIISCGTNSATFYVNNIPYDNLQDTVFCDKNVNFRAEIEGLNPNAGSLKWYIDEVPEPSAQDHLQWSKELDTGDHKIKMEVLFANNNTETLTCILKMNVFWIKMRNIRY